MNKITKIIIGIIILVLVVWGISSLVDKQNTPAQSGEPIRIGVIAPLTGIVADYGEEIRKGILDIGEIPGISFVFEDDKCDPKEAVTAFKKITEFDEIGFIVGPGCGSPQEAIIPLIKEKNTIVIVPSAASRTLYTSSGNNFFNFQYSLEDESQFIGEKLNQLNYKKVALVHYKNSFSETHANSFRETYDGEIVDIVLTDGTSDVDPELIKIKAAGVDAIYSPDIAFFFSNGLIKLRQLGVDVPLYSTYVAELPAVRTLVPDVYYSYPGDLEGTNGAVFELSKQAALLLSEKVSECSGLVSCVKNELISSGLFDEYGVFKRPIILKRIVGENAIEIK